MSYLKIPFSISNDGFLVRNDDYNLIQSRLRVFVLSGAGKFQILPSPGISSIWLKLTTMGQTSKLCMKGVLSEDERKKLENVIKSEVNYWLKELKIDVYKVVVLGDDKEPNGIAFYVKGSEYKYYFEFTNNYINRKRIIGNWSIKEIHNVTI